MWPVTSVAYENNPCKYAGEIGCNTLNTCKAVWNVLRSGRVVLRYEQWEDGNEDKNLRVTSLRIQEAFDGDHTVSQ